MGLKTLVKNLFIYIYNTYLQKVVKSYWISQICVYTFFYKKLSFCVSSESSEFLTDFRIKYTKLY